MPARDWTSRLNAYRRQGRSDAEIREIALHLEERGPRKPRNERPLVRPTPGAEVVGHAVVAALVVSDGGDDVAVELIRDRPPEVPETAHRNVLSCADPGKPDTWPGALPRN